MLKKLIDTNIFIDRFSNPAIYKDIFLSEGLVYLSSVVLMELKAGAHSKEAVKAVSDLIEFFRRVDRIVVPSIRDYEIAAELWENYGDSIPNWVGINSVKRNLKAEGGGMPWTRPRCRLAQQRGYYP